MWSVQDLHFHVYFCAKDFMNNYVNYSVYECLKNK